MYNFRMKKNHSDFRKITFVSKLNFSNIMGGKLKKSVASVNVFCNLLFKLFIKPILSNFSSFKLLVKPLTRIILFKCTNFPFLVDGMSMLNSANDFSSHKIPLNLVDGVSCYKTCLRPEYHK